MKNIITISGIRPDFIRMSEIFKKLDANFNHTLIHSGQHYDALLSDVFFTDLKIRKPDFNLNIGAHGKKHYQQVSDLSSGVIELIENEKLNPDLIVFLGDSNSVLASVPLRKEGYKIAHIEAGMRSFDKRMFEEINRTVCDTVSNYHFVYHKNYKEHLINEGMNPDNIHIVGNTICEVVEPFAYDLLSQTKEKSYILADVHRPENFNSKDRLTNIILYLNMLSGKFNVPVKLLYFPRLASKLEEYNIDLGNVKINPLMPYKGYITSVYHALCLVSDSGTAQEEPAFLKTPVIVPRDFSERPESEDYLNSYRINVNDINFSWEHSVDMIENERFNFDTSWMTDGHSTSDKIINILKEVL
jgi:UDP-N-acetylglucosamine 2-epimerase (non-hydrolysing)